ncbi:MAG: GIY-YIG nuclease family protein [Pseudomonadota bacterium]
MTSGYRGAYREPRPNHGVPGIVYLLANQGLRAGVFKIGSTRRSGWSKAMELNRDIHNTIPGSFVCEFEMHTRDSGKALELIFEELQYCHRGRKEQDYYELELERAREVIGRICSGVDEDILTRHKARLDQLRHHDQQGDIEVAGDEHAAGNEASAGVFKKAYLWMTAAASMLALVALAWVFTAWTDGNRLYASNMVGRQANTADASAAVQNGFTGSNDAAASADHAAETAATDGVVLPLMIPASKPALHDKYAAVLARLSAQERSAIGLACLTSSDENGSRKVSGDAFSACVTRQLAAFDPAQRPAGIAELNQDEKKSLEYVCLGDRYGKGLAAYNACLNKQLAEFDPSKRPGSMSRLSPSLQHSIQSACAQDKYRNGPAAYNQCLSRQLAQLG